MPTKAVASTDQMLPRRPSKRVTFPMKLHKLLESSEELNHDDVLSWSPCGSSVVIKDKKRFEEILPQYFGHSRLRSFQRQMSYWGFTRKLGYDINLKKMNDKEEIWSHPGFLRGQISLLPTVKRIRFKGCNVRRSGVTVNLRDSLEHQDQVLCALNASTDKKKRISPTGKQAVSKHQTKPLEPEYIPSATKDSSMESASTSTTFPRRVSFEDSTAQAAIVSADDQSASENEAEVSEHIGGDGILAGPHSPSCDAQQDSFLTKDGNPTWSTQPHFKVPPAGEEARGCKFWQEILFDKVNSEQGSSVSRRNEEALAIPSNHLATMVLYDATGSQFCFDVRQATSGSINFIPLLVESPASKLDARPPQPPTAMAPPATPCNPDSDYQATLASLASSDKSYSHCSLDDDILFSLPIFDPDCDGSVSRPNVESEDCLSLPELSQMIDTWEV